MRTSSEAHQTGTPVACSNPESSIDREFAAWQVGPNHRLPLDSPRLIGILNVTPDSFSDGGRYPTVTHAAEAALQMQRQGACIIDIGGESTRPGAQLVEDEVQIRRTLPVIEKIRRHAGSNELLLSIDTTRGVVAEAALDAGADIINDISAGHDDPSMFALAASRGCGLIVMHRRHPAEQDHYSDKYQNPPDYGGDIVRFIAGFLAERCEAAIKLGVLPERIVIDPGLGFGKTVEQNYELIARIGDLVATGYPVLCAASRKSFVGAVTGERSPAQRVAGSIAISVTMWNSGVRLFRVHDVAEHGQALHVAAAITSEADRHPVEPKG